MGPYADSRRNWAARTKAKRSQPEAEQPENSSSKADDFITALMSLFGKHKLPNAMKQQNVTQQISESRQHTTWQAESYEYI